MTGVLSRSVVDELFDRLDALDRPEIFLHLRSRDEVRRDHEASIAAGGPLAGMILAVKNNVDVAGFPTTAACPGYGSVVATDAPGTRVSSTARRRNSNGFGAGIQTPLRDDHRLSSGVRKSGSGSRLSR